MKRQANTLAAILKDWDSLNEIIQTYKSGVGSAANESEKSLQSVQGQLNNLRTTGTQIVQDLINGDDMRSLLKFGNSALELIHNITKELGLMGTAIAGLGVAKTVKGVGDLLSVANVVPSIKGLNGVEDAQKIANIISGLSGAQQKAALSSANFSKEVASSILEINGLSASSMTASLSIESLRVSLAGMAKAALPALKVLGTAGLYIGGAVLGAYGAVKIVQFGLEKLAESQGLQKLERKSDEQIEKEEKEHEEQIQRIREESEHRKQSLEVLQKVQSEYETLGNKSQLTAEETSKLSELQEQLTSTYGKLANGIDLVNGKYDEQVSKLKDLNKQELERQRQQQLQLYRDTKSQNTHSGAWQIYQANGGYVPNQGIIDAFTKYGMGIHSYIDGVGKKEERYFYLDPHLSRDEEIEALRKSLTAIENDYTEAERLRNEAVNTVYNLIGQTLDTLVSEDTAIGEEARKAATAIIETFATSDGIDYQSVAEDTYKPYHDALIKQYASDDHTLQKAIEEELSKRFEWLQEETETIVPEFSFSSWFEANDIDEVEKQINKLKDIVKSVYDGNDLSGEQRALLSDLGLDGMIDDADKLADSVDKLTHEQLNDLSAELLELLKNAKSLDEHNAILGAMQYIDSLSQSTSKVKDIYKEQTEELKKQIKTTQVNINNAKRRKEAEEQVLESLKKQKEVLENQIDQYEKAAQAVQDYIDDQIDSLNKQKSAIEETYNKQIEALQDEADERERLNDLREKELALENAKNSKVRTYSAGGFAIVQDNSAIKQAQADYDKALNDSRIAQLEKERDEAIKPIEEQIKVLEDYKDAWSEALHHYERVQNEMYAQTIFGSNWREAALSADANMVNSFVGVYDGLQNQLHNIVEPQIEQKERDIEAIDRQIESYEELKTNQQAYLDFFKNYSKDFSKAVGEQKKALEEFLNLVKQGKDQSGIFRAFDKVMQYFDTDHMPQFANGGTANFTGTAMLHGTANRAELILNNADAKKLYEVIHGSTTPQLTKSVIGNIFDTVKNQGMEDISSANTNNNNSNNYYTWTVTGNNIRADSYTEFKENMDRFVRQSQMDLDVGKR